MKNIVSYSSIFISGLMLSVGCANVAEIEPSVPQDGGNTPQSIVAMVQSTDVDVTSSALETRIGFTDNLTAGIDLEWESSDTFSVYEVNGVWVADFEVDDLSASSFITIDGGAQLEEGVQYIALFPARPNNEATHAEYMAHDFTASQSADGSDLLDNLSSVCQMSDEFTYGESVQFAHNKVIMTIQFDDIPVDATPTKVELSDGLNKNYELKLTNMSASESVVNETYPTTVYEVHMMIDPAEAVSRSLTFVVSYGTEGEVNIYNITTEKAYEAGNRYTAPIKNQNEQQNATYWAAISTAEELESYLNSITTKSIVLTADINMEGKTITTGTSNLGKIFDGNGHTISNLTKNDSQQTGLFFGLGSAGVVKNLTLQSPNIKGTSYVGAIAGKMAVGSSIVNCTIIDGVIEGTTYVGGIAGQSNGVVSGCTVTHTDSGSTTITATSTTNAGGIIGLSAISGDYENSISDCVVDATISTKTANAGGIVGKATSTTIYNSTFEGSVTATTNIAGGIVGYGEGTPTMYGCVNNGKVVGITKVGGIAGQSAGNIIACYNTGIVGDATVTTSLSAGIVAQVGDDINIVGCYNTNTDGKIFKGYILGGVATDKTATLTGCYYIADADNTNDSDATRVESIEELNEKVAAMNDAINLTNFASYNYVVGVNSETDTPTLIVVE